MQPTNEGVFAVESDNDQWMHQDTSTYAEDDVVAAATPQAGAIPIPEVGADITGTHESNDDSGKHDGRKSSNASDSGVYFSTPPSRSVVYAATRTKARGGGARVRRRIEPFLKAARSAPLDRLEDFNRSE